MNPAKKSRKVVDVECLHCGKKARITRFVSQEQPTGRPWICSQECRARYVVRCRSEGRDPWEPFVDPGRHSQQLIENQIRAYHRDGKKCVRCGKDVRRRGGYSRHVIHHKEPWKPGQKNPHRLENLETLCWSCHGVIHWELRKPKRDECQTGPKPGNRPPSHIDNYAKH